MNVGMISKDMLRAAFRKIFGDVSEYLILAFYIRKTN